MSKMNTTRLQTGAPWHRESFDKFLNESLPQLLARRMPLSGYSIQPQDTYSCRARVGVGNIEVEYTVLQPDDDGLFRVDGRPFVVVPVASSENLDTAEVKCVGEQLHDYVESRLGEASHDLPWDEPLVRAWLPLDAWVRNVVTSAIIDEQANWTTGQPLDTTNAIASRTHLRRIVIPSIEDVITSSQFGRVCPFETPEGPNIGRVFSVALGAGIRDGKIEIVDDRPEAVLGLTAAIVPFIEHNDANRQLMGVNMMRQWLMPNDPEPPLVQTGNEPDLPGLWCGCNLLTAFISSGAETYEDGIVVSESCAKRLSSDLPAETGDKLSNRHGSKGVIGRILPDDEMPHTADGTPVDLVYSFIGLHPRLNFGQIREAVMSRIAKSEGEPAIVPPFSAPSESELRERLRKAGLPEDGMEVLKMGRGGRKLERPSVVGLVYWGRTVHISVHKIHAHIHGPGTNTQGQPEYYALRDMGCFENVIGAFNTSSGDRADIEDFLKRVEAGPVEQAGPPTPKFAELAKRLRAAGIQAEFPGSDVSFRLASPSGNALKLAQPVPHPWLPNRTVAEVGAFEGLPEYGALVEANTKAQRILASDAPGSLRQNALADLECRVNGFFDALLTPDQLRFGNPVMFSGRTVLAPGLDLRLDQVGLAEEIAWTIFGPLVIREIRDRSEVEKRTEKAARALDEIMARSWIIVNRAPTFIPTALMAFHPVRIPERVIRLHPLVCFLMNGDFDGDQAAVLLPITEATQREAGEKLSFAGHLRRDPNLYGLRFITNEALWGLAQLSLTPAGLMEIEELAGAAVAAPGGYVDRDTVAAALRAVLERDGVEATLDALQRLWARGLQVTKESGASMSPFIGASLARPAEPAGDDPDEWKRYVEVATDMLQSETNYTSEDMGPQLLAVKSGARGSFEHLPRLIGVWDVIKDASGKSVRVRHGYRDGLTAEETFACVAQARERLARLAAEIDRNWYGVTVAGGPKGFGVLARAMRSSSPGAVFARAAAAEERDPLTDLDSRLFVGLRPT